MFSNQDDPSLISFSTQSSQMDVKHSKLKTKLQVSFLLLRKEGEQIEVFPFLRNRKKKIQNCRKRCSRRMRKL